MDSEGLRMKMGDIALPKNAGRIISSANQQYRLNLGCVAFETRRLTLTYVSSALLDIVWQFDQPFAAPPIVIPSIEAINSSVSLADIGDCGVSLITTISARVRLNRITGSTRNFAVGDTATLMAVAIGEAP